MKRILCTNLFLFVLCSIWSQDKLNILYPLTDFPGANIVNLVPAGNKTYITSIIYRENNTISSSAYFYFTENDISETKVLDFSQSDDGLIYSNMQFVSFGKNRNDTTLLQIRTYDNALQITSIDSIHENSNSTFPTNSKHGLNHNLFSYISDFNTPNIRLSTLLIQNDNGDILKSSFGENLKDTYITDIEVSYDSNFLLSTSVILPNNDGPFGQIIKIDTFGSVIWNYIGTEEFTNGAIVPYLAPLSNNNVVQTYSIEGDDAPHTRITWIDQNGFFLKEKTIDVPVKDELYYYEITPGKGDYFFAHGLYKFEDGDSYHAFLTKFDNEGEIIWSRYYQHEAYADKDEYHSIQDIHELDDGRIIILANAKEWFTPSNIWLFEVDSEGCYSPSCDDRQLVTYTQEELSLEVNFAAIYPNPADRYLYLPSHFNGTLSIIDMNGRQVFQTTVDGFRKQEIDVSSIQAGIYVCRMISKSGQALDKKLVIR